MENHFKNNSKKKYDINVFSTKSSISYINLVYFMLVIVYPLIILLNKNAFYIYLYEEADDIYFSGINAIIYNIALYLSGYSLMSFIELFVFNIMPILCWVISVILFIIANVKLHKNQSDSDLKKAKRLGILSIVLMLYFFIMVCCKFKTSVYIQDLLTILDYYDAYLNEITYIICFLEFPMLFLSILIYIKVINTFLCEGKETNENLKSNRLFCLIIFGILLFVIFYKIIILMLILILVVLFGGKPHSLSKYEKEKNSRSFEENKEKLDDLLKNNKITEKEYKTKINELE